jgi:hypothetical protein
MQAFKHVRLVVFGIALGFGLIILGIGANFLSVTSKIRGGGSFLAPSIPAFAVATAVLTFAILIPVIVIDFLRKGAMTSFVATELGFMGFLWILWLACASNATSALMGFTISDCTIFYDPAAISVCQQYQALQAFSWLGWLAIFFYWIALLVIALIAQSRGVTNAFLLPTTELTANMPAANATGEPKIPPSNYPPGSIPPATYPPQGQQYPQQGYPQQQTYTPSPIPSQGQPFQPSFGGSPAPQSTGVGAGAIHV